MATVFKLSKEGYDAETTDSENLIINSDLECLKIYDHGSGSISVTTDTDLGDYGWSGTDYDDITHNLGYVPAFRIFANDPDWGIGENHWQEAPLDSVGGDSEVIVTAYVDSTKLRIYQIYRVGLEDITNVINYKYYIFANKIDPINTNIGIKDLAWGDTSYGL